MIATAIVQNGGMFIPDVGKLFGVNHGQVTVNITIINMRAEDDPFEKAAGILRGQSLDPLTFEREIRDEWNRTPVD